MSDLVDLATARVRNSTDCMTTKPEDLLATVREDILKGDYINPKRLIVIVADENADGSVEVFTYRTGLNRGEEIGFLELAKHERMGDWLK